MPNCLAETICTRHCKNMSRKFKCDRAAWVICSYAVQINILKGSNNDEEAIDLRFVLLQLHLCGHMILKVNKCFLSALYNAMQWKMCGFRERKRRRTVTFGNCVGMPMFLYYDNTVNRGIIIIISVLPKDRSFTANSGTKAAILPKGRSSIAD